MGPVTATARTGVSPTTVLALVCASRVLDFTLRMGIVPFFPELADRFGISYAAVGGVYSAFFVGYAVLQIPFGWLADRWPESRLIALGLLGLGAGALTFVAAPTWQAAAAARLIMGAATAGMAVPGIRLVATSFPADRRGRAIGLVEVSIGASNLLALAGFPLLARRVLLEHLTLGLAAACLPLAGAFARVPATPRPASGGGSGNGGGDGAGAGDGDGDGDGDGERRPLNRRDGRQVLALFALGFLGLMALNGFMGWAPTYLREGLAYTPGAAAAVMAVALTVYLPAAYASGSVSDRIGRRTPVIDLGSALMLAAFVLMAFGGSGPAVVYAAASLYGLGGGGSMPALIAFSTEALGPARAGLAAGLMQVAAQAGSAVAGVVFGAVVDLTGEFTGIWWLGAALLGLRIVSSRLALEAPRVRTAAVPPVRGA